jgi:hypothetical protein
METSTIPSGFASAENRYLEADATGRRALKHPNLSRQVRTDRSTSRLGTSSLARVGRHAHIPSSEGILRHTLNMAWTRLASVNVAGHRRTSIW